ncbi:DUF2642 domain-containing protein [Paenibacillus sp. J2TS4]|uniref:DUF2642 domain-containing protein n=1 Tax=Paenibacillus sp. J2TS4 TaxID=2807194 RepID=UPI001B189284|nr:DUF2642 domain-containing protein [Paenibacillus sp. J2TS4]GIP35747.1 hypothetical protein J2TS4_49570 [Paenibacillus sp. J2TS4]
MGHLRSLIGQPVELEISGRQSPIQGTLVDLGDDILVVHNRLQQFLYVPLLHLKTVKQAQLSELESMPVPGEAPFERQAETISYRKILMNAKGVFCELYITGSQSIHGYLTSIMNDFFVFYSPVFHTIYIPLHHLKYLIPYTTSATPYSLRHERFPVKPAALTLSRTFDQQLKKLEGEFVVLDLGENPSKIGLLRSVENQTLDLVTAKGETVVLHLEHIKTIHLP